MWEPDEDTFYLVWSDTLRTADIQRGSGEDGVSLATYVVPRNVGVTYLDRGEHWEFVPWEETHERYGWNYRPVRLRNPRGRKWSK